MAGGGVVAGVVVGGVVLGGVGVPPAVIAFSTDVYAAFLVPEPSNSSGLSMRQESVSRMPQTVMPVQRETARQARVTAA